MLMAFVLSGASKQLGLTAVAGTQHADLAGETMSQRSTLHDYTALQSGSSSNDQVLQRAQATAGVLTSHLARHVDM